MCYLDDPLEFGSVELEFVQGLDWFYCLPPGISWLMLNWIRF